MTLSFTQQINGKPNYFIEKIWSGIPYGKDKSLMHRLFYNKFGKQFHHTWDEEFKCITFGSKPKLHTIREDSSNRWRAGMKIHPVINNRTPKRFQFAPVLECKLVQEIIITRRKDGPKEGHLVIYIDGNELHHSRYLELAMNDGFEKTADFLAYFNKDFTGKLIHWTDLKY